MNDIHVTIAQIDIEAGNVNRNFEKLQNIAKKIKTLSNHFLILPELWTSGYDYENLKKCAEESKNLLPKIKEISKNKKIFIIGSIPFNKNKKIFNRQLVFSPTGDILGKYDKIHLFKPLLEHKYFTAGNKILVLEYNNIKFGFALCYDLRFPELFRKLALQNVQIIFISAEWPKERIYHWEILNKARAIENQLFIVSCNRSGTSFNIEFGGKSMIINPSGKVIKQASHKEEIITKGFSINSFDITKKSFNILEDIKIKKII